MERQSTIKRVLVVGATGKIGQHLVAKATTAGIPVRAMFRDEDVARHIYETDMPEFVIGDLRHLETLEPALAGITHIVCAAGSNLAFGNNRPRHVDYQGVANLAAAASEAGILHMLLISSIMVTDPPRGIFVLISGNVFKWKARGEAALRASGVPYTIVRPGGFVGADEAQPRVKLDQGDTIRGRIGREMVADVCLELLKLPARNVTFQLVATAGDPVDNLSEQLAALAPD
jgi:uncharacterized protein YbjT (DUF2867 family)